MDISARGHFGTADVSARWTFRHGDFSALDVSARVFWAHFSLGIFRADISARGRFGTVDISARGFFGTGRFGMEFLAHLSEILAVQHF